MKRFLLSASFLSFYASIFSQAGIPKLNSLQGSPTHDNTAVIYLDFDGHFNDSLSRWSNYHNGKAWFAEPCYFSAKQVEETWTVVAEDYAPFQVNVTTDSMVFENAPYDRRIRVVITNTSDWIDYAGGVAYFNSIAFGDDTPVWVFPTALGNAKNCGDAASHEAGHAMDLVHHGVYNEDCSLQYTYNYGHGKDETSWAPIMGASYSVNLGTWDNEEKDSARCPGNYRTDLEKITRYMPYKEDDQPNDVQENMFDLTQHESGKSAGFHAQGLITSRNDVDVFKFTLGNQTGMKLQIKGIWANNKLAANNLDVKVELLHQGFAAKTYAPMEKVDVSIDSVFEPGTYYLAVSGDGNTEMSNYGSLGMYEINATRIKNSVVYVNLGSDTIICHGQQFMLDAGNEGAHYLWNTGETTQKIAVRNKGRYSVIVMEDDIKGTDTVNVDFRSAVNINFEANTSASCAPVIVALNDRSSSICGTIVSWLWEFGDGDTARRQNAVHQYRNGGRYNVKLSVFDSYGEAHSIVRTITISPKQPPRNFAGNDIQICEGETAHYDLTFMSAGYNNYRWSNGVVGPVADISAPGTYHVTVNMAGNCIAKDTFTVSHTSFTADFKLSQTSMFTSYFTDLSKTLCDGHTLTKWLWDFGDGTTSDLQHPSHKFIRWDKFDVRLEVTNNLGEKKAVKKSVSVLPSLFMSAFGSGPDPYHEEQTPLFYVPAQIAGDDIGVRCGTKAFYQLLSVTGQLLGQGNMSGGWNRIDTHHIQTGIFLISISAQASRQVIRLIKL